MIPLAQRNESVRLTLDAADFVGGMAKAAAATALLDKNLNALDGSNVRTSTSVSGLGREVESTNRSFDAGGKAIDRYSGRLALIAQAASVLGPALIPIGAVGVPAITGLATAATSAAVAGGSLLVAFQGVGDAVEAMNEQALNPSVDNLEKLRDAMSRLGPDAARFVEEFQEFRPVLTDIRDSAAAGWFPGLIESFDDFEAIAPRVASLFEQVGRAGGEMIADTAESFNSERWTPFLDFVTAEMPTALTSLGRIVGDLTSGAAQMWMAFDPGNDAFLGWLEGVAQGFDDWSRSAAGREDIAAFLSYVQETGPRVEEFFLALVDALTQVTQAAAPLGGPVLDTLSAMLRVVAQIADSDLGTPIFAGLAALSLYNRTLATTAALQAKLATPTGPISGAAASGKGTIAAGIAAFGQVTSAQDRARLSAAQLAAVERDRAAAVRAGVGATLKGAAAAGGLAIAMSGAADDIGLSNTASLALIGTLGGPWGAAIGGAVGFVMDLTAASGELNDALARSGEAFAAGPSAFSSYVAGIREQVDAMENEKSRISKIAGLIPIAGSYASAGIDQLQGNPAAEERERQVAALESRARSAAAAIGELAGALQMTIGPLDGSAYSAAELDAVLAAAQPRMSELRITADELTGAYQTQRAASDGLFSGIVSMIPGATTAFDDMLNTITGTTNGTNEFAAAVNASAQAARQEAAALRASVTAMQEKTAAALGAFDAETQYRQALRAATAQAKSNTEGIKGNSDAALANRGALGQLAGAWNNQSAAVKNNVARFKESRSAFIDTATAMGVPEEAARRLAARLLDIPKSVVSKIEAQGAAQAEAEARRVQAALDALRDRTVYINTINTLRNRTYNENNAGGFASGGFTGPGSKYQVAGVAHAGEVILPQEIVRRDKSLLMARYGHLPNMASLPGYADGGMVTAANTYASTRNTGLGPNSQLYGINQAFLSIAELGDRIAGLNANQLRDMARDIGDLNKKGLERLTKSMSKASEQADKELSQAKERMDAEKDALKSLREASKQFAESVASNFRSDVFGGPVDLLTADASMLGPGFQAGLQAFIAANPELQLGTVSGQDRRQAYLDSLTPQELAALQAQASLGTLQSDSRNAEAFEAVLAQLQSMGLTGGAFNEVALAGNLDQARALAAMGPEFIASIVANFRGRENELRDLGKYVGNVRFGADIREQLQVARRAERIAEVQLNEVRELRQSSRRVEQRLAQLEKRAERNPKETGREVGKAINGAVSAGTRSGK